MGLCCCSAQFAESLAVYLTLFSVGQFWFLFGGFPLYQVCLSENIYTYFLSLYGCRLFNIFFSEAPALPCHVTHAKLDYSFFIYPPGFLHNQQMGNCVSSQSQAGVVEKQAATSRGRSIVAIRKVRFNLKNSHLPSSCLVKTITTTTIEFVYRQSGRVSTRGSFDRGYRFRRACALTS